MGKRMGMKSSGDSHVYIERRKSTHTQDSNQISIPICYFSFLYHVLEGINRNNIGNHFLHLMMVTNEMRDREEGGGRQAI